ncbi:hypothetical protein HJ526_18585 [Donghicola sp. C2-DW-16]|uniref:CheW-like domain-containing protein n=1 Tax=Donghicola mangrovi TaxID=2729614 RepID=A0ABX2PJ50_9RHOB|nr:chemotaxis protein CheW [Donghicola mangrovi]NVO29433.1 hypothetical protein [Donghicola mangrovi]
MPDQTAPGPKQKQTAPKGGEDTLAVMDLGHFKVAVPVTQVREVVPCPEVFDPLPSVVDGVLGCFRLRRQIVPALDLPCFLGLTDKDEITKESVVVILTHEKMLLGILARHAVKLVKRADCETHEMRHNNDAMASRIVGRMSHDGTMSFPLLDIEALYAESVPLVRDTRAATRSWDHSDRFLLFETDGVQMCLPITQIETTIPETEVNAWTARSELCCGTIKSHGLEMALMDPLTLLGITDHSRDLKKASGVVIRVGAADRVAMRVDRAVDIINISESDLGAVPDTVYTSPHLIRGIVSRNDEDQFLVLDYDAMLKEQRVTDLGKVIIKSAVPEETGVNSQGKRVLSLLIDAGKPFAIDLAQVVEIVPWREKLADADAEGYIGTISHRNEMLPIFGLAAVMKQPTSPYGNKSAIIVVRRNGKRVGLAIQELIAVETISFYQQKSNVLTTMARRLNRGNRNLFEVIDTENMYLSLHTPA